MWPVRDKQFHWVVCDSARPGSESGGLTPFPPPPSLDQELDDCNEPYLAHDDAEKAACQAKRFDLSVAERMRDFFAEEAKQEQAAAKAAKQARRDQGDLSSLRMANVEFVKALDNALRQGCGHGLARWLPALCASFHLIWIRSARSSQHLYNVLRVCSIFMSREFGCVEQILSFASNTLCLALASL